MKRKTLSSVLVAFMLVIGYVETASAWGNTFWTRWFSEEQPYYFLDNLGDCNNYTYNPPTHALSGIRASGRYSDNLSLMCSQPRNSGELRSGVPDHFFTNWFSEEDSGTMWCGNGFVVTGVQCGGDYCDNLRLVCARYTGYVNQASCHWTAAVSEEQPAGVYNSEMVAFAMKCTGRYCDNMSLYMCGW